MHDWETIRRSSVPSGSPAKLFLENFYEGVSVAEDLEEEEEDQSRLGKIKNPKFKTIVGCI